MSILKYKGLNRGLPKWKINILNIFTNPFKMIVADINKCLFTKIFSHVGLVDVTHFQVVLLLL